MMGWTFFKTKKGFLPWVFLLGCVLALGTPRAQTKLEPADQKALNELEEQVTGLKNDVYQAKAKLRELEDAVLRGKITGSKALIMFENEAEGFFAFDGAEFYLDGQLIHKVKTQKGKKSDRSQTIFDSNLPSGEHVLKAKIAYRGNDQSIYAIFPYFKDHLLEIDTTQPFEAEYGKTTLVKLVALDRGYFKSHIKERLHVQVQILKNWGTD